jgi:hypothetical protein
VKVPKAVSVVTAQDGSYHACGIPPETRITAQARLPDRRSGWIEVNVPQSGMTVRDFSLGAIPGRTVATQPGDSAGKAQGGGAAGAASAAPRGSAVLVGTVTGINGKPLEGAQLLLIGTQLGARSDDQGKFRLAGLPAGTQSVEIRQIGYKPRRYAVDLAPHHETQLAAVLEDRAQVLDPVQVTAKKEDKTGFEQRRKSGFGTYLTHEDIERRGVINTTDIFRTIAGVQMVWDGMRYIPQMTRATMGGGGGICPIQYIVDGNPYAAGQEDIDNVVSPDRIEGIEIYKSQTDTPMEFQQGSGQCGTIVIWTRQQRYERPDDDK